MLQRAKLGMALFLLNEAVFFFLLLTGFIYFRNAASPEPARSLSLAVTGIYTGCLLGGCFTMWRVTASAGGVRCWLCGTVAFGAAFLIGQAQQYSRLVRRNITISNSLSGSTYFTLTGFLGLHVLVGVILLIAALFFSRMRDRAAVQALALYWYFVAAVWLVIFVVVYVLAFL